MSWFATLYKVGKAKYYGRVWARNEAHAKKLCAQRGMGEWVDFQCGHTNPIRAPFWDEPASWRFRHRMNEDNRMGLVHDVTYLCHLASTSAADCRTGWNELIHSPLADSGLLHRVIHWCTADAQRGRRRYSKQDLIEHREDRAKLLKDIRALERKIPGYWPAKYL